MAEFAEDRELSSFENTLRIVNIALVALILVCIYISYLLKVQLMQYLNRLSKYDNISSSGMLRRMIVEMTICCVTFPPFFSLFSVGEQIGHYFIYDWNAIISLFSIIKAYVVLRVYSYYSRWTNATALSICNKYKVKAGIHFAIKSELKKRPYQMLFIILILSLFIFAYAIRLFEHGMSPDSKDSETKTHGVYPENNLQNMVNALWLVSVTMTTVGYGDLVPVSIAGRIIGVFACIVGMLLVSLMVVSLAVIADFSQEEKKAYSIIKKLQADDNAEHKAGNVILTIIMLRNTFFENNPNSKKGQLSFAERFVLLARLKKEITFFKNDCKVANSYSLPIDEMLKTLELKLKRDIESLRQSVVDLGKVDDKLSAVSDKQKEIGDRIKTIQQQQDQIGEYIVGLNNQNVKKIATLHTNSDNA